MQIKEGDLSILVTTIERSLAAAETSERAAEIAVARAREARDEARRAYSTLTALIALSGGVDKMKSAS